MGFVITEKPGRSPRSLMVQATFHSEILSGIDALR